jgi:hypothetical protein
LKRGLFACRCYRPLGLVGPRVDPLGDVLMKLLPDGSRALLAPALAPPALKLPAVAPDRAPLCPVVVPLDIDPLGGAAPTPAAPRPLCASAAVLVNASAVANASVVTFIFILLVAFTGNKLPRRHMFRR